MSFDWASRYAERDTPWDLGRPHPELAARLESKRLVGGKRVLVPGCGYGHDALRLGATGAEVVAVDLVDTLTPAVGEALRAMGGRFVVADALELVWPDPFDLMWEHTFFCALDPSLRPRYGRMAARLVRTGGHLAAIAFPGDRPAADQGPPWRTTPQDIADALGHDFRCIESMPVDHPVATRNWLESWCLFARVGSPTGDLQS